MVDTTLPLPGLSPVCSKSFDVRFDGGVVSSDGDLLLFCGVEERLRLAGCVSDPRNPAQVDHTLAEIIGSGRPLLRRRGATKQPVLPRASCPSLYAT
jgi:hypothetical protein